MTPERQWGVRVLERADAGEPVAPEGIASLLAAEPARGLFALEPCILFECQMAGSLQMGRGRAILRPPRAGGDPIRRARASDDGANEERDEISVHFPGESSDRHWRYAVFRRDRDRLFRFAGVKVY